MDLDKRLRITEIFHSLQGESSYAGRRCTFVRLTGCDLRCTWCDTQEAYEGGSSMSLQEVLDAVAAYPCSLVEITGGEPLLQENVHPLMTALCDIGYEVLLETGGSRPVAPVDARVVRIIDVKCPSSGEEGRNYWPNLSCLGPKDEVKFVIADRRDYLYAVDQIRKWRLDRRYPVLPLISPVSGQLDPESLARWMLEDCLDARLQLQLHKLIWGADAKGV